MRLILRTARVILALGPLALSFLRDHRRWLWGGGKVVRTPEFHASRARRLVRTIAKLGPTFVKFAQVFAARADLIPEPYLAALGTLVDEVPPMTWDQVATTIRAAYGRDVDEVFENFEREPVGSASLAQVHRARYKGETVAVKVLRPGIEALVTLDLGAYRRAMQLVQRFWDHPHIRRELQVVDAVEVRIAEEVDFRKEAGYAIAVRKNFEGNPHIIIPRIHEEMIRQRVLVMEFVEGTRIDKLDPKVVNVRQVVQELIELYLQMQLIDGLFHADPHPGNLMVAPDGRIVLVDFGAVVRVPMATRRALMRTSIAAIRKDIDGVTDGFFALGLYAPETNRAHVRWVAELLIKNAYQKTTTKERIQSLLADRVMKTLFDSPVVLSQEAVYFGRAAALIEGIGMRYDPYFQQIPAASPVLLRMRSRILKALGEHPTPSVEELATVAGYALGSVARRVVDELQKRVGGRRLTVFGSGNGSEAEGSGSNGADAAPGTGIVKAGALIVLVAALGGSACAPSRPSVKPHPVVIGAPVPAPPLLSQADLTAPPCGSCMAAPLSAEVRRALEARIPDLKARGGACGDYGTVLEGSLAAGRISLRPYMWRVGPSLAAGEARSSGEMTAAREIDSLNVGVRTLDEVVWSVEHEAVHVAQRIASGNPSAEVQVDEQVRACRPAQGDVRPQHS